MAQGRGPTILKKWSPIIGAFVFGACGAHPDEMSNTAVNAPQEIDYAYTAPHENTSTANLIKEIENYDCSGLDEEVCATRVGNRELELRERGICRKEGGGFGACDPQDAR